MASSQRYDAKTGTWREIYGPDTLPKSGGGGGGGSGAPVTPKTPSGTPPKSGGGSANKGEPNKPETSWRNRQFNIEGTAVVIPDPHILARTVVDLRGLGKQFSGRYYIKSVTHTWNMSGYTQSIELLRNAFGGFEAPKFQPSSADTNREFKVKIQPTTNHKYHTTRSGDTLWALAKKYYGDGRLFTRIQSANNIKNANVIPTGIKLIIP